MNDLEQFRNTCQSIALMGGTFDPIHYGHLVAAEAARHEFQLDRVLFVPNRQPPHKKDYHVSPAWHRYHLTVLATISNPNFFVSRLELDRSSPSYTIDTLRQVRTTLGDSCQLYFISGADAIMDILSWRRPREVMELCCFIAATRPGFRLEELERHLGPLGDEFAHKVFTVEVPALAISSSDIRRRVAENRPIKYLLPEAVEHYIWKHDLYRCV